MASAPHFPTLNLGRGGPGSTSDLAMRQDPPNLTCIIRCNIDSFHRLWMVAVGPSSLIDSSMVLWLRLLLWLLPSPPLLLLLMFPGDCCTGSQIAKCIATSTCTFLVTVSRVSPPCWAGWPFWPGWAGLGWAGLGFGASTNGLQQLCNNYTTTYTTTHFSSQKRELLFNNK